MMAHSGRVGRSSAGVCPVMAREAGFSSRVRAAAGPLTEHFRKGAAETTSCAAYSRRNGNDGLPVHHFNRCQSSRIDDGKIFDLHFRITSNLTPHEVFET